MLGSRVLLVTAVVLVLGLARADVGPPPRAEAAFPGNNGRIVFSNGQDIFVVNGDGSDLEQITSGDPQEFAPVWSPDGSQIAYTAAVSVFPANWEVWAMNADGTGKRQLAASEALDTYPSWSPDGTKIAFQRGGGGVFSEVWVMNADGSAQTKIADSGNGETNLGDSMPDWSSDNQIAFISDRDATDEDRRSEVYRMTPTGDAQTRVTNVGGSGSTGAFKFLPSWSPDGSEIAFFRGDAAGIWVVSAAGGPPQLAGAAATAGFSSGRAAWSPDGSQFAYMAADALHVMNRDGSGDTLLATVGQGGALGGTDWVAAPIVHSVEFTQAIQQLQSISELQGDLEGDGQPPVPIIAGKPAAMRVYFNQVDEPQSFTVEVSGEIQREREITLEVGCTAAQRRRQEAGCHSVDFYFTPPEGSWSVSLLVKNFADEVVLDEIFDFTSLDADDITLKAVSVCDSPAGPGGTWLCQDPFPLVTHASLMRRMFPTANLNVIVTGDVVRRNEVAYAPTIQWWGQVNRDLDALHSTTDELFGQQGTEIYYYGLARNDIPSGTLGAAYIDTRGAASKMSFTGLGYEAISWVVAHEAGHAMGLDHTDTSMPALSAGSGCWLGTRTTAPPWPYTDNMLRSGPAPGEIEVGFDVANRTALPGDLYYDTMGYCSSAPPPNAPDATAWISPFSTMQLLSPAGPLSVDPAKPMAAPASAPGDFWLIQGVIDDLGALSLAPLVTLQLEGPADAGVGTHRIEVRDSSGVLFTRMFTPAHGHGSPSPGNPVLDTGSSFGELVPVQPGAELIQIFDAFNAPIAAIELGGAAPAVAITEVSGAGAASAGGPVHVAWTVDDPDSTEHTYWVDYSTDGGQTWQSQARGLEETEISLDAAMLAGSDIAVVRVIASDGVNSGEAVSDAFSVGGKLPQGEIIGPHAAKFQAGDLVWLEAAAWDVDDGTLDDGAVTWSSSKDGALGTGASLSVYHLSLGTHTITMTARDSDENEVSDSVTIEVTTQPLVEGEINPGDANCSGGADAGDALIIARELAGLDSGACQPIGEGDPMFGDADCSGALGPGDIVTALRFAADLAADLPPGCKPYGA